MKALVYTANEEMTYRDEPEPSAEPGEFPAECRTGSTSPTDRGVMVIPAPPSQSLANRLAELEKTVEALETELARVRETLRP